MYNPYLPSAGPPPESSPKFKEGPAGLTALLKRLKPKSPDSGDLLLLLLLLLLEEEDSDPELLLTLGLTLLQ